MATTAELNAAVAAGYKAGVEDATRMAAAAKGDRAAKAAQAAAAAEAEQRDRAENLARMCVRMAERFGRRR